MKYTFDRTSKKFICPNCNKKRFVRFIDVETNNYLEEVYGRCDRESSCGYFKKPEKIFNSHCNTIAKPIFTLQLRDNTVSYHSEKTLQQSLKVYSNNNFYQYLILIFNSEEVLTLFAKYKVGTSKTWDGATVFWQIDKQHKIRGGKIILFDKNTCKRVKTPHTHISWAHSRLKIKDFILKQCLFGLHLVCADKKIAIVESEKTAIIMALFIPEYTWLATGNKQNFKDETLYPIKNKEIIAFPDKSEFNDWNERAIQLNKSGFNISVSDYIEKMECEEGTDLADIYIDIQNQSKHVELSKDEKIVKKMATVNSVIYDLIETFDLCDSFHNPIDVDKIKKH